MFKEIQRLIEQMIDFPGDLRSEYLLVIWPFKPREIDSSYASAIEQHVNAEREKLGKSAIEIIQEKDGNWKVIPIVDSI